MSSPEELGRYSVRAWPKFSVPPGHLTPRGALLVATLGRYYGAHYQKIGLVQQNDCDAAYLWANRTQRTEATARALADGLLPQCKPEIHTSTSTVDPLFDAHAAGVGRPDYAKVRAAILGRMGGDPTAWSASQDGAVSVLDALLLQCESVPCPIGTGAGKRRLRESPPAVALGGPKGLVEFSAPAVAASSITESLLMSYADGHSFSDLGWRGITEETLTAVFALHTAEFELRTRTRYVAQITSSHLASRLLATLRVGAGLQHQHAAIGAKQPIIVISGHDGTLVQLSGLLGVDWILPGYQQNQAVPGGALVFEVWKRGSDGIHVLRLRYVAQSLRQLRENSALTESAPPLSAPIFVPGCSEAVSSFDCPLERFTAVVEEVIDPEFVERLPASK